MNWRQNLRRRPDDRTIQGEATAKFQFDVLRVGPGLVFLKRRIDFHGQSPHLRDFFWARFAATAIRQDIHYILPASLRATFDLETHVPVACRPFNGFTRLAFFQRMLHQFHTRLICLARRLKQGERQTVHGGKGGQGQCMRA